METGFIRSEGVRISWVNSVALAEGGVILAGDMMMGTHLPAFRCQVCRLLLSSYDTPEKGKESKLIGKPMAYNRH